MNMYVGNLNYRVKEGDLEQAMAAYGVVTSVKVIKDRETGKSKGFAFHLYSQKEGQMHNCLI